MSELANLHNIAFVGHPSTGKTTLVDALAHLTGASPRKGSVADRTSICDTEPEEQEKHHTLQMASVGVDYGGKTWTFLDTPGYPEFIGQVQSAMFAADLVVGVVSCTSGATFNLRTKMNMASVLGRGRAIIVTHLDSENADFDKTVHELRDLIGEVCVPALIPDGNGSAFTSVQRTYMHPENEWCQRLMDRVMDACQDEELLMEYLETQKLSEEQLEKHMPNAIARGSLIPVLVCNPESGQSVDRVLDYLHHFAPAPSVGLVTNADGESVEGNPDGPLTGTVYSVVSDPHLGKICMARIHTGTLDAHDHVIGRGGTKDEKLGGLFRVVGKKRDPLEKAGPGDLVAFSKVEKLGMWSAFGRTVDDIQEVVTPRMPQTTVALAIVPKSRADEQKIGEALHKLEAEDLTFTVEQTKDTHELVVHGMSDLHLQVMFDRMKRRYGVEVESHLPKIAFRQTITKSAEGHHRHKKQSGGRGQFGECYMRLKPSSPDHGVEFVDKVVGGAIPRNLIPAVEKGIREISQTGILIDGEVMGIEVELYDGKFHPVDSDEASFKAAGSRAFREGFSKAGPVLLEPIMSVEVHVPSDAAGTIFSDVTSHRRGHVVDQSSEADGAITIIKAEVPLTTMQTYNRDLKSQTAGEGTFSMEFCKFAPMPKDEQAKVLAASAKEHDDD